MELARPFELENCGCFYRLSATSNFKISDLCRQLLKFRKYKVIDFTIEDEDDEEIMVDWTDPKDLTFHSNIKDIDDVMNLIEHSDEDKVVYSFNFYIIFVVGDVD